MSRLFVVLILYANIWPCQQSQDADSGSTLPFLSAMCESRCLEEEEHGEIPSCMKPCLESKLHTDKNIKKCKKFCQDKATVSGAAACADSCSFLLQKLLQTGKTSSCSNSKACSVPASPIALNVTDKNATLSVLSWSSPAQPWAVGTIFIITSRSRPSEDRQFGSWVRIGRVHTTQSSLALSSLEERTLWYQFQVVAVNKFGASTPGHSAVVQLAVHKPNPPRDLKVTSMKVNSKGTVSVELSWKKPTNLDVPVHRYRVYWSERLAQHEWTTDLVHLRVYHARVSGKSHMFRKDELKPNRTYVFELQAICLWRSKRLRSKLTYITISTPFKSAEPTNEFDGNQNTKTRPGIKNTNKEAPLTEGPSILASAAENTASGLTTGAPSKVSSTNKTTAQLGLIATALLLLILLAR